MKERQLQQGDVGAGKHARLQSFLQGVGGVAAEPSRSVSPEQQDVAVTDDPHCHSIRHLEDTR